MIALVDVLKILGEKETVELYCDREVVVDQLNHKAGIKEKATLKMADNIWKLALQARKEKAIEIRFLWVSRKGIPQARCWEHNLSLQTVSFSCLSNSLGVAQPFRCRVSGATGVSGLTLTPHGWSMN